MTNRKAGAVFVDLTAIYETIWHRSLTCKLLHLLSDKYIVKMIMENVTNCSFTLTTGSGTCSRLRCLKNGGPQVSISQKFACAGDLAFMHSAGDWQVLEGALSQDPVILAAYLQTWQLKLSWLKMVSAAFILNNREAGRKLKMSHLMESACLSPRYQHLGVKLDRSLMYH